MSKRIWVIHGRFQGLHIGHMEYLLEGKKRCDFLYIGITNPDAYFIVKNSWGIDNRNPYDGFFYASEAFVKLQTINIIVHKDAISKELLKKLGIK